MRLTRECDYAFVVLAFLASLERPRPLSRADLATTLRISSDFLAKILKKLRRAGLVSSTAGRQGGYVLARSASEVTGEDVLRAMNDRPDLVECADPRSTRCPRLAVCLIVDGMRELHSRVLRQFSAMTLADLARPTHTGGHPA